MRNAEKKKRYFKALSVDGEARLQLRRKEKSTYVLVLKEAEHFELPEHTLRWDERLEHVGKFLERNAAAIAGICHCPVRRKEKKKEI